MKRFFNATAATVMIAASNAAFAVHYFAWKAGLTTKSSQGIDPFAGWVVTWLFVLSLLAVLELIVFVRCIRAQRTPSLIGSTLWVGQLVVIGYLYHLIQGV